MPESDHDAHRPLLLSAPLEDIFKLQARRKVSKRLTINYKRTLYVLEKADLARRVMGKHVMVFEDDAGNDGAGRDGTSTTEEERIQLV